MKPFWPCPGDRTGQEGSSLLSNSQTQMGLFPASCMTARACVVLLPFFGHTMRHAGSYLTPAIEPVPLRWEHGIFTGGPPGSSLCPFLEDRRQ